MDNLLLQEDSTEICRACLTTEELDHEWLKENENKCIFSSCTGLEMAPDDVLPKTLCHECISKCKEWLAFKTQCATALKTLESLSVKYESVCSNSSRTDVALANICSTEVKKVDPEDVIDPKLIEDPEKLIEIHENNVKGNLSLSEDTVGSMHDSDNSDHELKIDPKSRKHGSLMKCSKCNKGFKSQDRLKAHYRWHEGLKPEVCEVCSKEFDNYRALRRHKVKHEGNLTHVCNECGKRYKYANSLRLHKKNHLDVRRYICDFCGKSFVRHSSLQSHLISHSSETPFECEICKKKFKSKVTLQSHRIRHEGSKPHVCSECGKCFTTETELRIHIRSHTGIKPYACNLCDRKYKTKSHLSVHMRTHTGQRPFACDLCPLKFAHKGVLRHHRLTHTGEKPHVCLICNQQFRQKSTLASHMKKRSHTVLDKNEPQ